MNRLLLLLDREGPGLHALLYRLTLSTHAAEDLMQELFLKLASNPAFLEARNPAAYLRTAALHLALDWRRSPRNAPTAAADAAPADPAPSPLANLLRHEQWTQVLDAIATLTGQARAAFVLHYVQQESYEDIAMHLDTTPHHVRSLCHKAIVSLRARLATPPASDTSHPESAHAPD